MQWSGSSKRPHGTPQTPEAFRKRYNVDARVGHEVVSVYPASKNIRIRNVVTGETSTERYDKLIHSPGMEPIRPASLHAGAYDEIEATYHSMMTWIKENDLEPLGIAYESYSTAPTIARSSNY